MNHGQGPLRGKDIRKRNEKLILNIIHKSQGISQSEVSQMTGLKPPTVLRIFSKLEEQELIQISEDRKVAADRKGRRPVYYVVRSDAVYAVGVDFWSQSMTLVVVDFARNPVYEKTIAFPEGLHADQVLNQVEELIELALTESGIHPEDVLGIGVGAPGRVDIGEGKVLYYSRIPGMIRYPIRSRLEGRFQIPVHVHNNSSVIALNEYRYGEAKGVRSLLTILIRSGVGGAFINEGKLLVNGEKTTLELGHMSVDLNGPECDCGRQGCLETYISEKAILEALDSPDLPSLAEWEALNPPLETGENDPALDSVLSGKGRYLAEGIRTLYELFSPDVVLLLSRSNRVSQSLVKIARDALIRSTRDIPEQDCSLLAGHFIPRNAGLGAADLVFENYFSTSEKN